SLDKIVPSAAGAAGVASGTAPADGALVDEAPALVVTARGGLWTSKPVPLALLVVALVSALGALAGWGLGWFGGAPRPKARPRRGARPTVPRGPRAPRAAHPPGPPAPPLPEAPGPGARGPRPHPPRPRRRDYGSPAAGGRGAADAGKASPVDVDRQRSDVGR